VEVDSVRVTITIESETLPARVENEDEDLLDITEWLRREIASLLSSHADLNYDPTETTIRVRLEME
jgi:hypothetical protein